MLNFDGDVDANADADVKCEHTFMSSDLIHLSDLCICSAVSPVKRHSGIFQLRLTRL